MFAKSRKDKIVEQAQGLANDLTDAITPHVERARDELAPRLAEAKDTIAPRIADARDVVAPYVEEARDKIVNDVVPAVKQAASDARDQAAPLAEEAKRRGDLAAAALKGEDVKRKSGKKKWFLFAALAGAAAFAYKKLTGGNESTNWQSTYTPTPAPAAPPAPPSPSAPMAGSHVADGPVDGATGSDDATGATPGEALSDAVEEPHAVTTPDAPAEDVDVSDVQTPEKKA